MARGKHNARATSRRNIHLEATLDQLRSELEMEQTALSEAERILEGVTRLQSDLKVENTALVEEVTPYAEQLLKERAFLRSVFADGSAHHARVRDVWDRYLSAGMDMSPGATNLEKMESLFGSMGLVGWMNTIDHPGSKAWNTEQVTRLQRARGERRSAAEYSAEDARVERLTLALDTADLAPTLIRPSYRQRLIDENVVFLGEDGRYQVRDPGDLTASQNSIRDEAIEFAHRIWQSHTSNLDADSVHVWGSSNVVDSNGAPGEPRLTLGFTSEVKDHEISAGIQVPVGLPLASTPATIRRALALRSPEDILGAWRGVFESRRLVTERMGLSSHPFAPLAHHPQPGQGLAVQNSYALAAFSTWLHLDKGGACAETAVGLTAAATYWLPAGQTASFAESEPMDESDRAEMILPFPQVFLAFAEPLVLEPVTALTAQTEEKWRVLSEITHDVHRGTVTAGQVVEDRSRQADPWPTPTLDEMISELGAHVEGVLLLADSLGRPEDVFAWCLTIPGAYGATLGRFVVPALRSTTEYRDVIDNLTAVVAWAQWHEPDESTAVPLGVSSEDLEDYISSKDFQRNAKRAGAGIRVVDVGSTYRRTGSRATRETEGSDVHVTPHIRRGHWRRQRFGQGLEQIKRIRIAPVLVNAHRGDIAHRVYRLRRNSRGTPL